MTQKSRWFSIYTAEQRAAYLARQRDRRKIQEIGDLLRARARLKGTKPQNREREKLRSRERRKNPHYRQKQNEYSRIHSSLPESRAKADKARRNRLLTPEGHAKYLAYQREWRRRPGNRIRMALTTRVRAAVKGIGKVDSTMNLIGCSRGDLVKHLEKQFSSGMNWDNYGKMGWHIDHIRPCASFDMLNPTQQRECFHYTNLQPLWHMDNVTKSCRDKDGFWPKKPSRK